MILPPTCFYYPTLLSPPTLDAAPIHVTDVALGHHTTVDQIYRSPPRRRRIIPHLSGHRPIFTTQRRPRVHEPSRLDSTATMLPRAPTIIVLSSPFRRSRRPSTATCYGRFLVRFSRKLDHPFVDLIFH